MTFIETPPTPGFKQGYVPFIVTVVPGVAFFSVEWNVSTSTFVGIFPRVTIQCAYWRPSASDYHVHEIIVERRAVNTVPALTSVTIQMQHESVAGFFGADFVIPGGNQGNLPRVGSRRKYVPPLTLPFTAPGTALGNQGIRPMITSLTSDASAGDFISITVHMTQGTPV